jgi:hypothetical protein
MANPLSSSFTGIKDDTEINLDNADKLVWTTEKVDKLVLAMKEGYVTRDNPFYEGDQNFRRGQLVFNYSQFELDELRHCARDIVYFANTYCKVMTDDGYQQITLRDYQEEILRTFQHNRWDILMAPRQCGKTITSSIFLIWFTLFQFEKNALLIANKGATTKEIMDKIRNIIEGLPFFLKPGIMKKDVGTMIFDNKCRIITQNTTKTSGISFTIHLLFLDEFAHIQENIKRPFYGNIYPTLSSSKVSRVIISSTPNGYDLFHDLFQDALDGMNEYKPLRVDWWQVPGRDEAWKAREIANLGSEEEFNKQYGCQFLSSSSLLLNAEQILRLDRNKKDFVFREFDALDDIYVDYSNLKWDPDVDVDDFFNSPNFYVFSVDLAEGVGRDYSVINIFEVVTLENSDILNIKNAANFSKFFGLKQIGVFRNNLISGEDYAKILYELSVNIFNQENIRIMLEYNTYGSELVKNLITLYPHKNDFDEETFVKFKHRVTSIHKSIGIRYGKENKILYSEFLRECIGNGRMQLLETNTVDEAKMFSRNPNGTYSAQAGHDDLFMSSITAAAILETNDFEEIVEEFFDLLDPDKQKLIDEIYETYEDGEKVEDIYDIF